jgi:ribosomal protein S14
MMHGFLWGAVVLCTTASAAITKDQLASYASKIKAEHNLATLERDKSFAASKNETSGLRLLILGFPGPTAYSQVAANCDQCGSESFSSEQLRLCNETIRSLSAHLGGDPKRDFESDLKRAKAGRQLQLRPDPAFKLRLSSGWLKCDGQGPGSRLRIDFFPN